MIEEREPDRLIDALGTDPVLRNAIAAARRAPGRAHTAALIERIERNTRNTHTVTGPTSVDLRLGRRWLAPIGLALVVLGFGVSRFVPSLPAADSSGSENALDVAAAESGEQPRAAQPEPTVDSRGRKQAPDMAAAESAEQARAAQPKPALDIRSHQLRGPALGTGLARLDTEAPASTPGVAPVPSVDKSKAATRARRAPVQRRTSMEPPSPEPLPPAAQEFQEVQASDTHPASDGAAPQQTSLMPELQLLAAAQRALHAAPARALALTDKHAEAYPSGRFEQEREEIAIEALLALGQNEAARARARRFLARYPGSTHARRVSQLLSAAP